MFVTDLDISPMPDGRRWFLRQPLVWRDEFGEVTVPAGFVTDFASVPRLVWAFISPWGKHGKAAVLHDYLYWMREGARVDADALFLRVMRHCGQIFVIRRSMWLAVRLFGWIAWYGNAADKARGVNRILALREEPGPDDVAPARGLDRLFAVACRLVRRVCGGRA